MPYLMITTDFLITDSNKDGIQPLLSNNEAIVLDSDAIILYVTSYFKCYNLTS